MCVVHGKGKRRPTDTTHILYSVIWSAVIMCF